ncbi:arylamine N-acetyltransferase, pineal gland isozyme NAT-3-like [Thamnophis elegans]|uniref:arylamine N-acetyltransferase, pineal gland isozyme NAT-3-like n=1 Tax=Thamnophis elegans TaxID=35005 RepID=UPI001378981C|nr:arylamine N-acetyltransferase, pineal gland isozyme NAT-3-like [Thamnophis elegans]XP_032086069.1 arylamine N-acetyltransferase, pineal gland isozyme NAT-3-like [Thamnophis elegans]XP_032086070.1 arylamine N-acetyltransferase, pineal gland isozyme NAT-3-like [Thamnophis elegans]XP_032086071.1 arylamine N-acetyltransferase, pineal gland isozyme NAT-3-like [Thamnophis elegans]XP_032086072.1 arylamine N-acetyltransferase, pineal gland isozyme NAT-3-like [Thamnophis elegans]
MNIQDYFERICYKGSQEKVDLETLTEVFQHHIRAVPFENLSLHCGETIPLDLESAYDKIVKRHRGGWCMENNQLLSWVFQIMGYKVGLLSARVYNPERKGYSEDDNHLLIKVVLEGKTYIVDGGFGMAYQMWEPMELVSGKNQPQTPGIFCFTEKDGVWYFHKVKRKKFRMDSENSIPCPDVIENVTCKDIYLFTLQPKMIGDFRMACLQLQTDPSSMFLRKSICSLQTTDGFLALIGWTLIETKYNYKDDTDLVVGTVLTSEEVQKILKERFKIRLDKTFVPLNTCSGPVF